jgi:type II secretory pathway component GspD/PulD (secretin)
MSTSPQANLYLMLCALAASAICGWNSLAQNPPAAAPAKEPAPAAAVGASTPSSAPVASPAPAAAPVAEPVAEYAPASAPADGATVMIPLIVMDEVPLTDAVRNLARQAGINYMLDPKVSFGQPGADGKPQPQPLVSIRWERITAQQALLALLNNYGLQMVLDDKTHIARVMLKDPLAPEPLQTKVIQLQYATISNIISSVQTTLVDKRSKVVADSRTRQLVVLATEREQVEVDSLVKRLDTATRQVLIEARMLETSINPSTTKGVDWAGTLSAQNVSFGNGTISGTSTKTSPGETTSASGTSGGKTTTAASSVTTVIQSVLGSSGLAMSTDGGMSPNVAFLSADGVNAVLSFLNTYSDSRLISSPRMVTLDNEPAHIEVGQQYPIFNVTASTQNTTGGSQVNYSNLTVRLEVTPSISANDFVNLKVLPIVTRLASIQTLTVGGNKYQSYIFDTRNIETRVMIPSGNTLVMGGLIQDDVREGGTKVPILGDIPGLGLLFRTDAKSRKKSNLTVFITPTIIQDTDFQPTKTDFFKQTFPKNDSLEGDWSAWDDGHAKKWGKSKEEKEAEKEKQAAEKARKTAEAKPAQEPGAAKAPVPAPAKPSSASKFDDSVLQSGPEAATNAPAIH